jgi:hypothetical protein
MLIAGVMVLLRKRAHAAATSLGIMLLAVAVLTYGFRVLANLGNYGELTNTLKDVAVAGGAFILAGTLPLENRAVVATQSVSETETVPSV